MVLRAVGPDEKPERREPMTVTVAAKDGSVRDLLVAMRDRVAKTVESEETRPTDLAALTKRLYDIVKDIETLDARSAAGQGASGGEVGDAKFDPKAV